MFSGLFFGVDFFFAKTWMMDKGSNIYRGGFDGGE
jgi:hypothetical protein